jgi:geranylgeranyl diphosphate synthase, type II
MTREERTPEIVAEIRSLMERYESIEFTLDYARGIAREADQAFNSAFAAAPPSADRDFVRDLVPYMLGRRA